MEGPVSAQAVAEEFHPLRSDRVPIQVQSTKLAIARYPLPDCGGPRPPTPSPRQGKVRQGSPRGAEVSPEGFDPFIPDFVPREVEGVEAAALPHLRRNEQHPLQPYKTVFPPSGVMADLAMVQHYHHCVDCIASEPVSRQPEGFHTPVVSQRPREPRGT